MSEPGSRVGGLGRDVGSWTRAARGRRKTGRNFGVLLHFGFLQLKTEKL